MDKDYSEMRRFQRSLVEKIINGENIQENTAQLYTSLQPFFFDIYANTLIKRYTRI